MNLQGIKEKYCIDGSKDRSLSSPFLTKEEREKFSKNGGAEKARERFQRMMSQKKDPLSPQLVKELRENKAYVIGWLHKVEKEIKQAKLIEDFNRIVTANGLKNNPALSKVM